MWVEPQHGGCVSMAGDGVSGWMCEYICGEHMSRERVGRIDEQHSLPRQLTQ